MQIKVWCFFAAVLLLSGCNSYLSLKDCSKNHKLSPTGAQVKFSDVKLDSRCRLIGKIEGVQSNCFSALFPDLKEKPRSMQGAANDIRNKAAAMGGNIIYGAIDTSETFWSYLLPMDHTMTGMVYRCP